MQTPGRPAYWHERVSGRSNMLGEAANREPNSDRKHDFGPVCVRRQSVRLPSQRGRHIDSDQWPTCSVAPSGRIIFGLPKGTLIDATEATNVTSTRITSAEIANRPSASPSIRRKNLKISRSRLLGTGSLRFASPTFV